VDFETVFSVKKRLEKRPHFKSNKLILSEMNTQKE